MQDSTRALEHSTGPIEHDVVGGKYRLEKELGRGGMGVVFSAMHLDLEQRVAIKILHPDAAANPDFAARFAREARIAARVRSDHVAQIIDVGTFEGGAAYIVMELLEGLDSAELLKRDGALSLSTAAEYLLQACEAVAAAHAAGIVHRDLKPANLFLARRPDGTRIIKVLDFGVAKRRSTERKPGADADDAQLTRSGQIFGSPAYMSPEQLQGSVAADFRTDVWALGATLYELCTGVPPFGHSSVADIITAVLRDRAPSIVAAGAEPCPKLDQVIARCLEKKPVKRYANVGALARALAPFGPPGAATSVDRIEQILGTMAATQAISVASASVSVRPRASLAPPVSAQPVSAPPVSAQPVSAPPVSASASTEPPPPDAVAPSIARRAPDRTWPVLETTSSRTERLSAGPKHLRHPVLVAAAGLAVLAAVGVTAVRWTTSRVGGAPHGAAGALVATPPPASSAPDASAGPVPLRREAAPEPDASAALPANVTVTVTSARPGTRVYVGDALIGVAPGPVHVARGAQPVTLRFLADGDVPVEASVVPNVDQVLVVSPRPLPSRPAVAKPKPPKEAPPVLSIQQAR